MTSDRLTLVQLKERVEELLKEGWLPSTPTNVEAAFPRGNQSYIHVEAADTDQEAECIRLREELESLSSHLPDPECLDQSQS